MILKADRMQIFSARRIANLRGALLAAFNAGGRQTVYRLRRIMWRSERRYTLSQMDGRQMADIGIPPEEIRAALNRKLPSKDINLW